MASVDTKEGWIEKTPTERFTFGALFTNGMASGEAIVTLNVTSKNKETGVDSTATIIASDQVDGGNAQRAIVELQAGQVGERHVIKIQAITDAVSPQTLELHVELAIADPSNL